MCSDADEVCVKTIQYSDDSVVIDVTISRNCADKKLKMLTYNFHPLSTWGVQVNKKYDSKKEIN